MAFSSQKQLCELHVKSYEKIVRPLETGNNLLIYFTICELLIYGFATRVFIIIGTSPI